MKEVDTYLIGIKSKEKIKIKVRFDHGSYNVKIVSDLFEVIIKSSLDYLDTYKKLQSFFEDKGYLICLNGSRIDINASGFLRDSTNGLSVYLFTYEFEKEKKILDIFDVNTENIGTIDQQKEYFKEWKKQYKSFLDKQ